ncbi:hypothetical protein BDP27DRAFT_1371848 [Rhodocollybia butyracea]|uniref:Uncharacterized protein n=1 Tax=Rhodocollybia butyracea TaxID=206335 RepID=A0A9P5TYE3_9AGAR|nr:hypothetical protein BDP27DRAFT_1371848 [Rhodocollybia butyracea]
MTTVPLPSCNKCSAPKWDSQYEAQLATFFEEYKIVVHDASITADQEKMKKEVLRYDVKSWEDFKTEVFSNYPGLEKLPEATTEDLKKIVAKYGKEGWEFEHWGFVQGF